MGQNLGNGSGNHQSFRERLLFKCTPPPIRAGVFKPFDAKRGVFENFEVLK